MGTPTRRGVLLALWPLWICVSSHEAKELFTYWQKEIDCDKVRPTGPSNRWC